MTIPILPKWNHLSFSNSWWHPLAVLSEIENIFHLFIHTHYKVVKSLWDHTGAFLQITKYQNELLKKQGWLCNKQLNLQLSLFSYTEGTPLFETCLACNLPDHDILKLYAIHTLGRRASSSRLHYSNNEQKSALFFGRQHHWSQVIKRTQMKMEYLYR